MLRHVLWVREPPARKTLGSHLLGTQAITSAGKGIPGSGMRLAGRREVREEEKDKCTVVG